MRFTIPTQPVVVDDPKKLEAAKKAVREAAKGAWEKASAEGKAPQEVYQDMVEAGGKAGGATQGLNVEYEIRSMMVGTSFGIREAKEEDEGGMI